MKERHEKKVRNTCSREILGFSRVEKAERGTCSRENMGLKVWDTRGHVLFVLFCCVLNFSPYSGAKLRGVGVWIDCSRPSHRDVGVRIGNREIQEQWDEQGWKQAALHREQPARHYFSGGRNCFLNFSKGRTFLEGHPESWCGMVTGVLKFLVLTLFCSSLAILTESVTATPRAEVSVFPNNEMMDDEQVLTL